MTNQTIEHIICPEGKFWRETRTRQEIDPGPAFEKAFSKKVAVSVPRALFIEHYGAAGLRHNPAENATYWTVLIPFINLRCEFRPVEDDKEGKIVVPKFLYRSVSKEVITIKWDQVPDRGGTCPQIVMLIKVVPSGSCFIVEAQWLFAFDARRNVYQLPTANLYDHLMVCTGEFDSHSTTHMGCLTKALTQFENSQWNDHLYYESKEEMTANFFRFRPTKDGFETLNINSNDWTQLCQKRSVQFTEHVVI